MLRVATDEGRTRVVQDNLRFAKKPARTWRRERDRDSDPDFADWVGRRLHETYDPIAHEPLPGELATLIRRLDQGPEDRESARG